MTLWLFPRACKMLSLQNAKLLTDMRTWLEHRVRRMPDVLATKRAVYRYSDIKNIYTYIYRMIRERGIAG